MLCEDLQGLEVFDHDTSKLGHGVFLSLLVLPQSLLDAPPQDDQDFQQPGDDGYVFAQLRFHLPR